MRAEGSGGRRSDQALMGKGSEDERREGHQSLTALILPGSSARALLSAGPRRRLRTSIKGAFRVHEPKSLWHPSPWRGWGRLGEVAVRTPAWGADTGLGHQSLAAAARQA